MQADEKWQMPNGLYDLGTLSSRIRERGQAPGGRVEFIQALENLVSAGIGPGIHVWVRDRDYEHFGRQGSLDACRRIFEDQTSRG